MTTEEPIDDALLARAREISTPTLHEAAGRIGALPASIKPLAPHVRVCGRAYPVASPPGDNLWLHHAICAAAAGDVLVVDVRGEPEFGHWGDIMSVAAMERRLAGVVVHGAVRDSQRLLELGFPVFCTGTCIRGPTREEAAAGSLGEPVTIGEVRIVRGDLVVGDADGVLVLPRGRVARIVADGELRDLHEQTILRRLHAGETTLQIYGLPGPRASPGP